MDKIKNRGADEIFLKVARMLHHVSKDNGLFIDYAKICWCAMYILKNKFPEVSRLPINVKMIYDNLKVHIEKVNLNEFMEGSDVKKINRIIGKISIRPDYITNERKITVYVDEEEPSDMINYALAHELCHLLYNNDNNIVRYTDDYSTMPMLPKKVDELIADSFAVFLLIPLDRFLEAFKNYIRKAKILGNVPVDTREWLGYLSSVADIPYDYVACAYHQMRHVAFLMYNIKQEKEKYGNEYTCPYGNEIMDLYNHVEAYLDDETLELLYQ